MCVPLCIFMTGPYAQKSMVATHYNTRAVSEGQSLLSNTYHSESVLRLHMQTENAYRGQQ